jgi:nucleotide-binding universal stress UspA family protein
MAHVLVPLDGTEVAERALEYAVELFPGARLSVLVVIDPASRYSGRAPGTAEVWYRNAREQAERRVADAAAAVDAPGVTVETHVETDRPARAVVTFAEEHGVDHIVMGCHGREGVSRLLLGSTVDTVVRRSPVPVTVVR